MQTESENPVGISGEKSGRDLAEIPNRAKRLSGLQKWKKRVTSNTRSYYGKSPGTEYVIRVQVEDDRRYVLLGSADLDEAAEKARAFFFDMTANGWAAATLRLHPAPPVRSKHEVTVGEYLLAVAAIWPLLSAADLTYHGYCIKLRTLLSRVFDIKGAGKEKWKGPKSIETPWQKKIHAIRLIDISPGLITDFMLRAVATTKGGMRAKWKAKHSVNSLVSNARALFSKNKIIPKIKLPLPTPLPFEGVKLLPTDPTEYRFLKEVEPEFLIQAASEELAVQKPQAFMIFLLALGGGLRRNEIDKLEWRELLKESGQVEVAMTEVLKPKSKTSLRRVKLPATFYRQLILMRGKATSTDFVISSERDYKENRRQSEYRCDKQFGELIAWLRTKGLVRDLKAVQTLRKHFGDRICATQGIYKASKALGHQKVETTEMFYVAPPDVEEPTFELPSREPVIEKIRADLVA